MKKDDGNSLKWIFLVLGVLCFALIMVSSYRLSSNDAKSHIEDRLGSDHRMNPLRIMPLTMTNTLKNNPKVLKEAKLKTRKTKLQR